MIPLRDDNPTHGKVFVVPLFIAINVVVFFFVQPFSIGGGTSRDEVIEQLEFFACNAAIPYEVMHGEPVSKAPGGALDATSPEEQATVLIQRDACANKNVWLSILFSMFLHGGLLHLGGNMLFLWVFGNNIEDRLGPLAFVAFYLVAGVVATFAQSALTPSAAIPLIGASGAVAGVLGAYLLLFPKARVTTLVIFFFITAIELPAIVVLGIWFVLQLFSTVGPASTEAGGVAYMAHVAGFVAGMVLLLVFRPKRPRAPAVYLD
ncbi:MAG TPA: rhomboid family intramembrane serine protease [Actinomycetota bacterium]|nr:rhomboid family intramembrane serine protease [Actinomycetota bacterium]